MERLPHKLELQSSTTTRDAHGGVTVTWSCLAHIYASVRPASAVERERGKMVEAKVTHIIRTRYDARIVPSRRFTMCDGDRVFNITQVLNFDERNRELTIGAEEVL